MCRLPHAFGSRTALGCNRWVDEVVVEGDAWIFHGIPAEEDGWGEEDGPASIKSWHCIKPKNATR